VRWQDSSYKEIISSAYVNYFVSSGARGSIAPMSQEMITVGGLSTPRAELKQYATQYLRGPGIWSYPAYDGFEGSGTGTVREADLLAICLLNAGQKPLQSFYTLKSLLVPINERLADPQLKGSLAEAGQGTLEAIADLAGILDDFEPTPEVRLTKLMKVLHRMKPELIPLYDQNIWRLYLQLGTRPVPRVKGRSRRDFALDWLPAVQEDLRRHMDFWQEITDLADPKVPITPLRALDICAWKMGEKR